MSTQREWISFGEEDKQSTVELKDDKLIDKEDVINDSHNIIIEMSKIHPWMRTRKRGQNLKI